MRTFESSDPYVESTVSMGVHSGGPFPAFVGLADLVPKPLHFHSFNFFPMPLPPFYVWRLYVLSLGYEAEGLLRRRVCSA